MWGLAASLALNTINNHLQSQENLQNYNRNLQAQRDLMNYQNNLNSNTAINLMNLENAYNHPKEVLARELSAGMNPYAIASEYGAGKSAPADISTPRADIPSLAAPQTFSPLAGMSSDILSIAQAYTAMANAKKAGIETEQLERNLETWLSSQQEQLTQLQLDNNYKRIQNDIYARTGDRMQQLLMSKVAGEVLLNYSSSKKNFASISEIQQNINESISRMNLNDKNAEYLENQIPFLADKLQAEINTINKQGTMYEKQGNAAMITANAANISALATARNQMQQATNAKELLEGMKKVQSSQEFGNNINGLSALLDCYMKFKSFPMLQQSLRNKVEQELKNLDWTDTDHVVDNMSKLMNAFSNALGTVGSFIPKTP